jgi:hypothetical protein
MFVHGADFFLLKPGVVMTALGLPLLSLLAAGPRTIGDVTFSLYWMLAGAGLTLVGLQSFLMGCIAQVVYDYTGDARRRWLRWFPYTRTAFIAGGLFLSGLALAVPLVTTWLTNDLKLSGDVTPQNHLAVLGVASVVAAFTLFTSMLLLHAVDHHGRRPGGDG